MTINVHVFSNERRIDGDTTTEEFERRARISAIDSIAAATQSGKSKRRRTCALSAVIGSLALSTPAVAQIAAFEHIVVIVQENRTPDNLFYSLCGVAPCSTILGPGTYDIQTSSWANKKSISGLTTPQPMALTAQCGMSHLHKNFEQLYDGGAMDGEATVGSAHAPGFTCPALPGYHYVDNSTHAIDPYITMALSYGWANLMFQSNQGPSFPAHLFIFGGTSALSAAGDAAGIFMGDEPFAAGGTAGCIAKPGSLVQLITPSGPGNAVFPCSDHQTLGDALDLVGHNWKYYTPDPSSIWTAPAAIDHICVASGRKCTGTIWRDHVSLPNTKVLIDIASCNLSAVSWVTPTGQQSDHPQLTNGSGPSWISSIVNAIGNSTCGYWANTAIVVTWDDWGGWYDHEPPILQAGNSSDYQLGARVPLLFISAYTAPGTIDNTRYDFGSIARFIERNFAIGEGFLGFDDARAVGDLSPFYNLAASPRGFATISAPLNAAHFLNDKSKPKPADTD